MYAHIYIYRQLRTLAFERSTIHSTRVFLVGGAMRSQGSPYSATSV
jgi:hypothetical protein